MSNASPPPAANGGLVAALLAFLAGLFSSRASAAPAAPAAPIHIPGPVAAPEAPSAPVAPPDGLTARGAAELVGHEAIVCEAYRDVKRIWTWGIGVTDASGHKVARYIDNPQTVQHCLEVFLWLLRTKYLPDVLRAFRGYTLTEAQLSAALSFHYNTGAIATASWVQCWKDGDLATARAKFMQWDKPASVIERREKECELFFDGKWSGDGRALVIPVLKPSYQPDFRHATRVDVMGPLETLIG